MPPMYSLICCPSHSTGLQPRQLSLMQYTTVQLTRASSRRGDLLLEQQTLHGLLSL